jgi:hypothetical protein
MGNQNTGGDKMTMNIPFEPNLRDWYAGLAMQGLLSNGESEETYVSEEAYKYADAMMKERDK